MHKSELVKPILKEVQSKETKSVETMPVKKRVSFASVLETFCNLSKDALKGEMQFQVAK